VGAPDVNRAVAPGVIQRGVALQREIRAAGRTGALALDEIRVAA